MELEDKLRHVLDATLGLRGQAWEFDAGTPLLGALPQLDSMAVAHLLTAMEEQIDVQIPDDEIDGSVFATFGSLLGFVQRLRAEQEQERERLPG
jgi:acyl carrier protein